MAGAGSARWLLHMIKRARGVATLLTLRSMAVGSRTLVFVPQQLLLRQEEWAALGHALLQGQLGGGFLRGVGAVAGGFGRIEGSAVIGDLGHGYASFTRNAGRFRNSAGHPSTGHGK